MPFTEEELEDMFNRDKIITYGAWEKKNQQEQHNYIWMNLIQQK